jgi:hypothetical protein
MDTSAENAGAGAGAGASASAAAEQGTAGSDDVALQSSATVKAESSSETYAIIWTTRQREALQWIPQSARTAQGQTAGSSSSNFSSPRDLEVDWPNSKFFPSAYTISRAL